MKSEAVDILYIIFVLLSRKELSRKVTVRFSLHISNWPIKLISLFPPYNTTTIRSGVCYSYTGTVWLKNFYSFVTIRDRYNFS